MREGDDPREGSGEPGQPRLIYANARDALDAGTGRAAIFEIGERTSHAILGDAQQAHLASTLELGTRRLRDHWLGRERSHGEGIAIATEWVATLIGPTAARFDATGIDVVGLAAPSLVCLARLAGRRLPSAGTRERHELTLAALAGWHEQLSAPRGDRETALVGLDRHRLDDLLPAAIIARAILGAMKREAALVFDGVLASDDRPRQPPAPLRPARVDAPRAATSGT